MKGPRRFLPGKAWLLFAAVLVVSLNFRGPIVAPSPVLGLIRSELEMSSAVAGLLTAIPVLCFGLATPAAAALISRSGANLAVILTMIGVLAGSIVRSTDGTASALAGTAVIGLAVTIGNIVLPVIIRRDFAPRHANMVMGGYTAAMNVGSLFTSLLTAPLAAVLGWRVALVAWSVLAVVGVVIWARAVRAVHGRIRESPPGGTEGESGNPAADPGDGPGAEPHLERRFAALRRPLAWLMLMGFGAQAFSYYGITAWLPTILQDLNGQSIEAAGASSSLFQIFGAVGALAVPLLATRLRASTVAAVVGVLWITLPVGLMAAPSNWFLWSSLGGIAQGGGITIIFIILMRLAGSDRQAAGLSAMVQGGGYTLAAMGPSLIGALHDAAGSWYLPLTVISGCVVLMGASTVAGGVAVERRRRR